MRTKYATRSKKIITDFMQTIFFISAINAYAYPSICFSFMIIAFISFVVLRFVQDDYCYTLKFISEGNCLLTVEVGGTEFGTFKFNLKTIVVDRPNKLNMQIRDNDYQKNSIQIPYCKKLESAIQQEKDYLANSNENT